VSDAHGRDCDRASLRPRGARGKCDVTPYVRPSTHGMPPGT
jgi:hypothetical protein